MQVPSAYSAKQIGGRRAYDLAREGKEVALPARPVEISRLCIREIDPPYLRLSVTCSSGTYVRALGRDLGRAAGCPLTMSFLLRTEMGPFRISEAKTLEEIEATPEAACGDLRMILSELPQLTLTAEEAAGFLTGKRLRTRAADAEEAAVCGPQGFLGIAAVRGGVIHPKKYFHKVCRMIHIVHELAALRELGPIVAAAGFFDGFHAGHQAVLAEAKRLAAEKNALPGVITFHPHPEAVLFPERPVRLLETEEEKERYMEEAGMAFAAVIRPTKISSRRRRKIF